MGLGGMIEVRIENTNYCGYNCTFCPRDQLTRDTGIMPVGDFILVLQRVDEFFGEKCKSIHLHGFGEPLLDRSLPEKARLAKQFFPGAVLTIVTTLGVKVSPAYLEDLVEGGLDQIYVSFYSTNEEGYRRVTRTSNLSVALANLKQLAAVVQKVGRPTVTVQYDMAGNVEIGDIENRHGEQIKLLCAKSNFIISTFNLHNYGAGRKYNEPTKGDHICSVVGGGRKNIIQVTWDLNVKPCCFDFNAEMAFGNLRKSSFEQIYDSPEHRGFIKKLAVNDFSTLRPCQNCDRRDP